MTVTFLGGPFDGHIDTVEESRSNEKIRIRGVIYVVRRHGGQTVLVHPNAIKLFEEKT